jgi:hypothetical protein
MDVLITSHPADLYANDHQTPISVVSEQQFDYADHSFFAWGDDVASAYLEMYAPPNREARLTFVGRWVDADGVAHAQQLDVNEGVNVYDFGRYRAVVTT